ncbi:hypothetical protein PX52LOC_04988 [Limnoglobus roseus]|uniref:Uncharacterized protein n=1 Tax=Limnoglobus roseus TaxID=2598579 RepID=A0A5C1ALA9_9BACT|nr:hypothetical protein PX52LOC_04988 [Limnoglobus roseus]
MSDDKTPGRGDDGEVDRDVRHPVIVPESKRSEPPEPEDRFSLIPAWRYLMLP